MIPAVGTAGGILLGFNLTLFDLVDSIRERFSISVKVVRRCDNLSFWVTAVYGPSTSADRHRLWDELRSIASRISGPWVMGGDFNVTRYSNEFQGGVGNRRDRLDFCEIINDLQLYEPPMSGRAFTWSNLRENPCLAKLDRFLVSTEWLDAFPHSFAANLPKPTSDHSPIGMWTGERPSRTRRIFRFEKMWLSTEGFTDIVKVNWSLPISGADAADILAKKLKRLRKCLHRWEHCFFGNISKAKVACLHKIEALETLEERGPLPAESFAALQGFRDQLRDIAEKEEIMWK